MITKTSPVIVDWVTAVGVMSNQGSWMRRFLSYDTTKPINRAYHQTHGVEYYPSLMRHYYSPDIPENTSILVADGQCLGAMRTEHDNDWCNKVVAMLARSSAHFSRIDLALDVMDGGSFARFIAASVISNQLKFTRRKAHVWIGSNEEEGCTTYVGSRTSPKMLRIYDKNAESKGKHPTSRIEFELKSEAAERVSELLRQYESWRKVGHLFTGLLNEFGDWTGYKVLEDIIYGETMTIEPIKRERMLPTKEWLSRQVMPTFVKEPDGKGLELWTWFKEQVESSLTA